jgi:hypothetical protein
MADSEVEICNLALLKVGVKTLMSALDEQSNEGLVSKTVFPQVRDYCLTDWQWTFATARAQLAELDADSQEQRDGWAYAYALPENCLKSRGVYPGTRSPALDNLIPSAIELNNDGDGLILLTDVQDAQLIYTRRVFNVKLFPPKFVAALVWALAAEFVLNLPLKPELEKFARDRYMAARNSAGADDANSTHEERVPSKYETARR